MVNDYIALPKVLSNFCLSFTHAHKHSHTDDSNLSCKVLGRSSGAIWGSTWGHFVSFWFFLMHIHANQNILKCSIIRFNELVGLCGLVWVIPSLATVYLVQEFPLLKQHWVDLLWHDALLCCPFSTESSMRAYIMKSVLHTTLHFWIE